MMHEMSYDLLYSCTFEVIMVVDKCTCAVCCYIYFSFLKMFPNRSRQVESRQDSGLPCKLEPEPNA